MPKMLTTAQVADRLGIGRRAVARRVERGKLAPLDRLPGRTGALLFDAEQIDRLAHDAAASHLCPEDMDGGVTAALIERETDR